MIVWQCVPRHGPAIGELVRTEQEHPQFQAPARDSRPFIARHWRALTIALIIAALLVGFVLYLRTKQPVAAPPRGRNGQTRPGAAAVGSATVGGAAREVP